MGLLSAIGSIGGALLGGPVGAMIGGTLGGSIEGTQATNSATNAQVNAANYAAELQRKTAAEQLALQKQMYEQGVARQEPWYAAGKTALSNLQTGLRPGGQYTQTFKPSDIYTDPSYAFRLQQGQKALEQSAAARGIQFSGGTQAALSDYAQNAASQEYGNAYNRFMNDQNTQYNRQAGLAGVGQSAGQNIAGAGSNYAGAAGQIGQTSATNLGNIAGLVGQAQAAGAMGSYNMGNAAMGNLMGYANQYGSIPSGNFQSNPYGWGGGLMQSNSVNLSGGGTFSV